MYQHFHALKGSALNLGFESFAKLCKQGEEESANGNSNPVAKAQVNEVYLASKTEFLEKYDGPSFG